MSTVETEKKEKPILFSGSMVLAILAGRKTQTRRILKGTTEHSGPYNLAYLNRWRGHKGWEVICPYGKKGDRLWVRECFGKTSCTDSDPSDPEFVYRAHGIKGQEGNCPYCFEPMRWKPSIHMPRRASRINLEITDIRVENLQEINDADARAEGWPQGPAPEINEKIGCAPVIWYRSLWDVINGPESWAKNPYVWVLSFKVVK